MPEGHKTHRLAIDHAEALVGQTLRVTSPQGRFRADARKVSGHELVGVEAVGKHLFYRFDNDRTVHVHLGRYGSFRVEASPPPKPIGQIRMRMVAPHQTLDLRGPTRCDVIDDDRKAAVLERLGPDPLAGGRRTDVLDEIAGSRKPIGTLLLDQSVVAGVGNIFRAEMLFEAEINPLTPGNSLTPPQLDRLWKVLMRQMRAGLRHGKIISVSAKEAGRPLSKVEGKDRFWVYGHTHCPKCNTGLRIEPVASRRMFWCPSCQA